MKAKNLLLLLAISLLAGGFLGGYLQGLPFSMSGSEQRIVIPLDGMTHKVYGKTISSDINKGLFLVNGEPIYNGEVRKGVWLAHQKTDAGLFVLPVTSALSVTSIGDITPPSRVWVDPSFPRSGEIVYYHSRGTWDDSEKYSALTYQISWSSGIVDYGSTVTRKRSGDYDTSTFGVSGNKDAITGDDTLYREFKGSLTARDYRLLIQEYYSGVGKGGDKVIPFTVSEPVQPDTTAPSISSFTVTPSSFTEDDAVSFKAEVTDTESGVYRVYIKWYNNGGYKSTLQGDENGYESSGIRGNWFAEGTSTVTLVAEDGKGNVNQRTVSVTLKMPTPPPEPVLRWEFRDNKCTQKSVPPDEAGAGNLYETRDACEANIITETPPPTTTSPPAEDEVTVYLLKDNTCVSQVVKESKISAEHYLSLESCEAEIQTGGEPTETDNNDNLNRIKDESPLMFLVGFLGTSVIGGVIGRRAKLI